MKKIIGLSVLIYLGIQFAIKCGYREEKESDYILDAMDTTPMIKTPPLKIHNLKPDTTQYKGNWIDINE